MLVISGTSALSDFRRNKALDQVRRIVPACRGINVDYVYFIHVDGSLSDQSIRIVAELLNLKSVDAPTDGVSESSACRYVVPRIGTISPWSTKGYGHISIIVAFRTYCASSAEQDGSSSLTLRQVHLFPESGKLEGLVFDPMVESLLESVQSASSLFSDDSPSLLATIDLLAGGREELSRANTEFGFALSDEETGLPR